MSFDELARSIRDLKGRFLPGLLWVFILAYLNEVVFCNNCKNFSSGVSWFTAPVMQISMPSMSASIIWLIAAYILGTFNQMISMGTIQYLSNKFDSFKKYEKPTPKLFFSELYGGKKLFSILKYFPEINSNSNKDRTNPGKRIFDTCKNELFFSNRSEVITEILKIEADVNYHIGITFMFFTNVLISIIMFFYILFRCGWTQYSNYTIISLSAFVFFILGCFCAKRFRRMVSYYEPSVVYTAYLAMKRNRLPDSGKNCAVFS